MTTRIRRVWAGLAVLTLAASTACSGGGQKTAPASGPPPDPNATAEPTAEPKGKPSVAFDALTRQKLREDEFVAAIRDLENASGATEAANDFGLGYRRLLGIPAASGEWSKLPGVEVPRAQIPKDVRLVKIAGIFPDSGDRHMMRYEMLAMRFAKDYNATMIRSVK
jgi:hypothetical protein